MRLLVGILLSILMIESFAFAGIDDGSIESEIENALNEVSQDFFEKEDHVTPSKAEREKIHRHKISLNNDGSVIDDEPDVELDLDENGNIEAKTVIEDSPSSVELTRTLKSNGKKTLEFTYNAPVWTLNSSRLKVIGMSPQAQNLLSRKPKSSVQRCQVSGHFKKREVFVLHVKKCKSIFVAGN